MVSGSLQSKLVAHMCLCHKQDNLVPVEELSCPKTGKVTVGLPSHWPHVTVFSGLSTYELNGLSIPSTVL